MHDQTGKDSPFYAWRCLHNVSTVVSKGKVIKEIQRDRERDTEVDRCNGLMFLSGEENVEEVRDLSMQIV